MSISRIKEPISICMLLAIAFEIAAIISCVLITNYWRIVGPLINLYLATLIIITIFSFVLLILHIANAVDRATLRSFALILGGFSIGILLIVGIAFGITTDLNIVFRKSALIACTIFCFLSLIFQSVSTFIWFRG